MTRYLALRFVFAVPALWLILTVVFLLAHIVPGDPVQQMLGEGARDEDLNQLRQMLGLDSPLPVQYARYVSGVLRGDLGESFRFQPGFSTARAKGLSESAVLFRHAFGNALIPIPAILGLQFGILLAGAIVTEMIFSCPGIGRLAVQAIAQRCTQSPV
ncbi:MAG: ABC transporter permease [Candidatus Acidiferrales bacterium]|jgi:peptide/nickel transport system permease protein